jgi:voltage-gated potassium channel Kch
VVLSLGAEVAVNVTADTTVRVARGIVTSSLIAAASVVILKDVLRAERVTFQKICGGISVYLLFGILCANLYMWLAVAQPGAFTFASGGEATYSQMLYYSVVTLTTLGYGDIFPVAPSTRVLASLEALLGQLYLTVLIARLVALQITQEGTRRQ